MANIIGTPLEIINDDDILKEVLRKIGNNQQMLYQQIVKVVDFYRTAFASTDPETFFSTQILSGNILNVTIKSGVLYIYYKDGSKIKTIKFNLYPLCGGSGSNNNNNNTISTSYGKGIVKLDAMLESGSTLPELAVEGTVVSVGGTIYKFSENQWSALEQEEAEGAFYAYGNKLYDFINGVITLVIDPGDALTQSSLETLNTAITTIAGLVGDSNTGLIKAVNTLNTTINGPTGVITQIQTLNTNKVNKDELPENLNVKLDTLDGLNGRVTALENKKDSNIIPIVGKSLERPDNNMGNEGDYWFIPTLGLLKKTNNIWSSTPSVNISDPSSTLNRYTNTYVTDSDGLYKIIGTYNNYKLVKIAKNNVIYVSYWKTAEPIDLSVLEDGDYWLDEDEVLHEASVSRTIVTWNDIELRKDTLYVRKNSSYITDEDIVELDYPELYWFNGENLVRFFEVFQAQIDALVSVIGQLKRSINNNNDDEEEDEVVINDKNFFIYDVTTGNPGIFTINKNVEDITANDVINAYTIKTAPIPSQNVYTARQLGLIPGTDHDAPVENSNLLLGRYNAQKLKEAFSDTSKTINHLLLDDMYPVKIVGYAASNTNTGRIVIPNDIKISGVGTKPEKGFMIYENFLTITHSIELDGISIYRKARKYNGDNSITVKGAAFYINYSSGIDYIIARNCHFYFWSEADYFTNIWFDFKNASSAHPIVGYEETKVGTTVTSSNLQATGNELSQSWYVNHIYFDNCNVDCQLIGSTEGGGLMILKSCRIVNSYFQKGKSSFVSLGAHNETAYSNVRRVIACPTYVVGNTFVGSTFMRREPYGAYYNPLLTEGSVVYMLHNKIKDFVACTKFNFYGTKYGTSGLASASAGGATYDTYNNVTQMYFVNNDVENLVRYDILVPGDERSSIDTMGTFGTFKAKSPSTPSHWWQFIQYQVEIVYKNNYYHINENRLREIINNTVDDYSTPEARLAAYNLSGDTIYPVPVNPNTGVKSYYKGVQYLDEELVEEVNGELRIKEVDGAPIDLTYLDVAKAEQQKFAVLKQLILDNFDELTALHLDQAQNGYLPSTGSIYYHHIEFSGNTIEYPSLFGSGIAGVWGCGTFVFNDNTIRCKYVDSGAYKYRDLEVISAGSATEHLFCVEAVRNIFIQNNTFEVEPSSPIYLLGIRYSNKFQADGNYKIANFVPKHDTRNTTNDDTTSTININISNNKCLAGDNTSNYLAIHSMRRYAYWSSGAWTTGWKTIEARIVVDSLESYSSSKNTDIPNSFEEPLDHTEQ